MGGRGDTSKSFNENKVVSNIDVPRNARFREARAKELAAERAIKPETSAEKLARTRKEAEVAALARETPVERSERERHATYIKSVGPKIDSLVDSLGTTSKISDGKWSARDLKDIKLSISGVAMTNGMADPGKIAAIRNRPQHAAIFGVLSDSVTHSKFGDMKSVARSEKLAKRIRDEGIPRSIVDNLK